MRRGGQRQHGSFSSFCQKKDKRTTPLRNSSNRIAFFPSFLLSILTTNTAILAVVVFAASTTMNTAAAMTTISRSQRQLRVAVLGSGVAGSTAARALAENGVGVTVFESGRGAGGRTSTRVVRSGDSDKNNDKNNDYQFDHGAQYISNPKTEEFRSELDKWVSKGLVREWSGRFATVNTGGGGAAAASTTVRWDNDEENGTQKKNKKWVGYPTMSSICGNLLRHENIQLIVKTRAEVAAPPRGNEDDDDRRRRRWDLRDGKTKKELGSFDWLVVTDRNSGAQHRTDLSLANVPGFTSSIRGGGVRSVKSLTAMVAFEEPLKNVPYDGIQFVVVNDDGKKPFGSLGWAARDTSKPGRERRDGKECWVLQSRPEAATELLRGRYKIDQIRRLARDALVSDFLEGLPLLAEATNAANANDAAVAVKGTPPPPPPRIAYSVGHRWGAAFPVPLSKELTEAECHPIPEEQFVACGDYYGKRSGRIEGAFLSGRSAAMEILKQKEN